ncbi:MAG: hypothetical protein RL095_4218 [Verrucomicrobiota bacterium]|jgi:hypothetical protein
MADQKIATEPFSRERPDVVHLWSNAANGLRWTDEAVPVARQLLRRR